MEQAKINPEIKPVETKKGEYGPYTLVTKGRTFQIWYGTWTKGYSSIANGEIKKGSLCITYRNPYHKMPIRVVRELQKQFNPEIKSNVRKKTESIRSVR